MAGHGVQLLKLTSMIPLPKPKYQKYPAVGPNCNFYGTAATRVTGQGLSVAGNVGKDSYIQWHELDGGDNGGRRKVVLDYIMADSELVVKSNCARCREAYISCNGGPEIKLNMPSSGNVSTVDPLTFYSVKVQVLGLMFDGDDVAFLQSWDDVYWGYLIELDGFLPGATNSIKISNHDALAPDFVSIGIEVI